MSYRLPVLGLVACAAIAVPCQAQEAPQTQTAGAPDQAEPNPADDIVVTANKTGGSLQKAPAAISVVTGENLSLGGATEATQLTKLIPSLVVGQQGSNSIVFLRGVGQSLSTPNSQPGTATNINGVYLPRELGTTALYDLERVEVLPGPQGTLWGRNAAGGAINFVTKKPGKDLAADGFVEIGNYWLAHAFGAATIPFADSFSVRAAIDVNRHDGYLSNGGNDKKSLGLRLTARFEPSDVLSVLVMGAYQHEGGLGPQMIARGTANPPFGRSGDPWFSSYPTDGLFLDIDAKVVMAQIDYKLSDHLKLTYLPGFMDFDREQAFQFNGNRTALHNASVRQYSQELRLSNDGAGRSTWVVGLYWYKARSLLDVGIGLPPAGHIFFSNRLNSYAAFGQYTYSLTDSFRLTAGGRYSHDEFDGGGYQTLPPPYSFGGADKDNRLDWKVGAELDVAPRSMIYATAQSGYLQGGFTQTNLAVPNAPHTFAPVSLVAFTVGTKNRFADNKVQINSEAFYYIYKDYQLQTAYVEPSGASTFVVLNVPRAIIYGNQLDLAYLPTSRTSLKLGIAAMSAKITRGLASPPTYDGFRLPNAPALTINGEFEQRFPFASGAQVVARVATLYNSGYWGVFTHDLNSRQKRYTKTDANLTFVAPQERWSVGAFVRNIENSAVYMGANASVGGPAGYSPSFIDAPRTYGLRFDVKF